VSSFREWGGKGKKKLMAPGRISERGDASANNRTIAAKSLLAALSVRRDEHGFSRNNCHNN
jgi:hypothetical protein